MPRGTCHNRGSLFGKTAPSHQYHHHHRVSCVRACVPRGTCHNPACGLMLMMVVVVMMMMILMRAPSVSFGVVPLPPSPFPLPPLLLPTWLPTASFPTHPNRMSKAVGEMRCCWGGIGAASGPDADLNAILKCSGFMPRNGASGPSPERGGPKAPTLQNDS